MDSDTSSQVSHEPTSSLYDAMRVTHKALRAYFERLRGRAELQAHLGMKEIEERLDALEPKIARMTVEATERTGTLAREIRTEMSALSRRLRKLDAEPGEA